LGGGLAVALRMYCKPMVDVGLTGHPPAELYRSSG